MTTSAKLIQTAAAIGMTVATTFLMACVPGGESGETAYEVETPGTGRYDKIKLNVGIVVSDGSIQVKVPRRVSVGDSISVTYNRDGKNVTDTLSVDNISTKVMSKGTLCRLHTAPEGTVGDTVYIRPCEVLR